MREINLEYIDTFKHTQKERERERQKALEGGFYSSAGSFSAASGAVLH